MNQHLLSLLSLCVLLARVETLHGIARAALLVPRVGKRRALRIAIVTGSLLAFGVCYWFVPRFGYTQARDLLLLGLQLAVFMALFDISLGRLLLRLPWRRVLADFNPRGGNYLSIGLMLLLLFPWLVMQLRSAA
jgi:threonine/homoserine efflux transporter RhtA